MKAWAFGLTAMVALGSVTLVARARAADSMNAHEASIPFQLMSAKQRGLVTPLLEKATLTVYGPAETFACRAEDYRFLLDHPDRAVTAWRRLGAKCVSINPHGENQFSWTDDNGSEMTWEAVLREPDMRIWYAEGKVRPGPLLPLVPVKAVVVLRYQKGTDELGGVIIRHQSELFMQTDSKTVTMLTKMLGSSANKLAESGLGQLQLFFSGLSWYLDRHPEQSTRLLRPADETLP